MASGHGGSPRFGALRHRDFRILWIASLVSNIGTWMQIVTQGWLIYTLTNSAAYLGLMGLMRAIPLIAFPLVGGVLADRMPRVRILVVTQIAAALLAAVLATLTVTDAVQAWHVLAFAFLNGIVAAFDQPARQALLPDLVSKENLMSGISLNAWAFNGAILIGPALAGLALPYIGIGGSFYANAISFLAVLWALFVIRPPEQALSIGSAKQNLIDGLRFVFGTPAVLWLIAIVFAIGLFGRGYAQMFPVFARDALGLDAQGLSVLYTLTGLGACVGAVLLAFMDDLPRKGPFIWAAGTLFGAALAAFAFSHGIELSFLLAFIMGLAVIVLATLLTTSLQLLTPPEFRGRVMSVYTLCWAGMEHVSLLLMGTLASLWAASFAVGLAGVAIVLVLGAIILARPDVRSL
ncbi:MAG: hypothetical protein A3H35_21490 [Betaproteobacteria bacterium RIFCSPLOWO2_02_FULL_62_17]|nr:MAG: hypothetical protein A3H35_21490 [Betaproteobacteria bacterium RIFCSPLOWO2_02_FULL_62_17]